MAKRALIAIEDPDERMMEMRRLRDLSIEKVALLNSSDQKASAQKGEYNGFR